MKRINNKHVMQSLSNYGKYEFLHNSSLGHFIGYILPPSNSPKCLLNENKLKMQAIPGFFLK